LVTSSDNKFDDVIPGVELDVLAPSADVVSVDVAKADSEIVTGVQEFVDAFNSLRDNIDEVTEFNAEDFTTGILFGTTAVLRVESDLNHILSGRFFGVGEFTSLEAIGLGFDDKGKLTLDAAALEEALAEDPTAVEELFTHETLGVSARLKTAIEQLAGEDNSVLSARAKTLSDIITGTNERITRMDERLTRERERLLNEFALLESTVAAMQQNLSALASLQIIPPLSSTSSDRP
jgi:flagellar hook-associated protein 2